MSVDHLEAPDTVTGESAAESAGAAGLAGTTAGTTADASADASAGTSAGTPGATSSAAPEPAPPAVWMDNPHWWVYPPHPCFAPAMARFHSRNRHHLRMAMTVLPEMESPEYWGQELTRRMAAMQAGHAVHLIGLAKEALDQEIGSLTSFWAIEHGDFQACTLSFMVDRSLEGRNLSYAVVAPAVREVLRRHGLHRIMATHLPENLRSAALLRRLGFTVEGYARDFVRVSGHWRDNVLLSLVTEPRDRLLAQRTE